MVGKGLRDNRMNFRTFLTSLVFLLTFTGGVVGAGEPVALNWAFFLKSEDGRVRSLDFAAPEPVVAGELFRIYLELQARSFVYLYLLDSRDDLYLVFPPNGSFYNGDVPVGYKFYIPSGREWFALDDLKGTERFYLLAASRRLLELEDLTDGFLATGDPELKGRVLAMLEEEVALLPAIAPGGNAPVPVNHGERPAVASQPPRASAHKISAPGGYGIILEMVNK
jgi:hypothetical protein